MSLPYTKRRIYPRRSNSYDHHSSYTFKQCEIYEFLSFEDIETISPRPMLFITGENAHSREFSEDAYRLAAEPKELYIVPGAGHVDLYDRVSLIPFDKLESFFKEYLKK